MLQLVQGGKPVAAFGRQERQAFIDNLKKSGGFSPMALTRGAGAV
jgi:hypothetical protein